MDGLHMILLGRWMSGGLATRLLVGMALSVTCGIITPAVAGDGMPGNARASAFGGGWDCVWGYRRVAEHCESVKVPANGYLEASGRGWECERGFAKVEEHCVKVNIPPNAYLGDSWLSGGGWECDRGYRRIGNACAPITLPANAYLADTHYGREWE